MSSDDEVSEAEMPSGELEIGTHEESLISFRLSGPNERLFAGQRLKDTWEGRIGYRNIELIISRFIIWRDGSSTVVLIRIRTNSDAGCLRAPFCNLAGCL